ncbi:MAG: glycosyltransferase family 9 protein [Bacteroidales bacterium]|nr:glycosyltransferase family 9 protein [Bacteroidales bacterium]
MKKILVIRFSSIGDIVLTSPIVRCLKNQIMDCELHFLTKKAFVSIVENNPNIDKVHSIEKDVNEIIPQLYKEGFDFVVDLHNNIRTYLVKKKLKKPSASFNKLNIQKWILVNFKRNFLPDIHIVDRYFQAIKSLGIKNDNKGLDFFIDENNKIERSQLPETHRNGFVGFVIGGKHSTKMLPEDKIISICKKIDKPIILLGGPEDFEKGEIIQKNFGDKVYNSCGKYSINQSASLIFLSEKVITNDTGLMHIAAAYKKKIVSVWGNTVPAFGMYPYLPEVVKENSLIVEVKNLNCRPCSKIGFKKCPKKHFKCMNLIDEEKIVEFMN